MNEVKSGIYKHYKGDFYLVLGVSRNSETLKESVIYQALYETKKFGFNPIWDRPKEMFTENVVKYGKKIPRFEFREDKSYLVRDIQNKLLSNQTVEMKEDSIFIGYKK